MASPSKRRKRVEPSPVSKFRHLSTRLARKPDFVIFLASFAIALVSALYLLSRNPYSLLYYGDSISHLVISRKVIDSITPGYAQLGTVWLPLNHIMMLPFIWNNYLFHTGLAGTIVSGFSMAVTDAMLFRIAKFQFNSTRAGVLASILYLLNPSVLYMGIIPMAEAPFVMFFILAVYYLQMWYHSTDTWKQYRSILKCSLAISLATLTRYEGWILPFALIFVLFLVLVVVRKEGWKARTRAFLVVAVAYSSLGPIAWALWNYAIFRDPLAFVDSPYSAQNQALGRPFRAHLFLQPLNSLRVMGEVANSMYGMEALAVALVGLAVYLIMRWRTGKLTFSVLTLFALLAPVLATFAAMVEGSGEIYPYQGGFFNGEFLVFLYPFVVFCSVALVMFFARRRELGFKILSGFVAALIVASFGYTFVQQPLVFGKTTAMNDPLGGSSVNQADLQLANELGSTVHGGHIVLYTLSGSASEIMLLSNLDLKSFIVLGSGQYWNTSQRSPWVYGTYLVWARQPNWEIEALYNYWQANSTILSEHYQLIYQNSAYYLFQNRTEPDYSISLNTTLP
ncbi:MAG: glycosyltransferase family 39 protein [Nitrososphaerales archaeon]|nr:glycosyltransferase family 39 protein [Nitrososphaerales archaeon]